MGNDSLTAVVDTGPVIHLDQLDSLTLLSVFDQVILPSTVYEELAEGTVPDKLKHLDYDLKTAENPDTDSLDPGEAAGFELARTMDAVFLTDDLEARQTATEHGIEVHGSIGVITRNYRRGKINQEEAENLIRRLQLDSALFTTDAVIKRGIQRLRELD